MLSHFSVENYRAFAREQTIAIRPLTLFFGWNSCGKSALLRFLPLLVESIREAGPTIWLKGEVGREALWSELVCKATRRSVLNFSLQWDETDPFTAKWEIDGELTGKWQENRAVLLKEAADEKHFAPGDGPPFGWAGYPERILPLAGSPSPDRLQIALHLRIQDLMANVQWIGGVRSRLPRLASFAGGNPTPLKADGSNVFDHLIALQQRPEYATTLQAIDSFFVALGERLVFDNPFENNWRVMLSPIEAPEVKVNLCDTGEGYSQVLPVLTALARARDGGPGLLCLEQPELHLHTRAQAELAKFLVATAQSPKKPRMLVETHSEVLLTSVQLAIANGEIAPEDVRVYWIESRSDGTSDAVAVDFDALGRPLDSTMVGAFNDALEIGRKLLRKQMEQRNRQVA